MASWESPMSTVGMETLVLEIFPRVEPPGISLLFVKVCVGTFARRQRSRKKAAENPSVAYLCWALNLMTIPSFKRGAFTGSAYSP